MKLKKKYRMVIGEVIYREFDLCPSHQQMIDTVKEIFPQFKVDNEPIIWKLETIFFMEES